MALFGWSPRDVCVPLLHCFYFAVDSVDLDSSSGGFHVDAWLRSRSNALRKAQVSLEYAREAMMRAQKASDHPHVYSAGDLVKIFTKALHLTSIASHCNARTQAHAQVHRAMTVVSASDRVVQVKLPASYNQVHEKLNVIDVRPWLHSNRTLDVPYPAVAHLALNPKVQTLDRKTYGRRPRVIAPYLDIPCSYRVVRKDQNTEWVRNSTLPTAPE
jgi:hypothetical protein